MTQDDRWLAKYNEVMKFMEYENRNPSKYDLEQRDMYNWLKATRKKLNAGELKEGRIGKFNKLLALSGKYKRVNQWK